MVHSQDTQSISQCYGEQVLLSTAKGCHDEPDNIKGSCNDDVECNEKLSSSISSVITNPNSSKSNRSTNASLRRDIIANASSPAGESGNSLRYETYTHCP